MRRLSLCALAFVGVAGFGGGCGSSGSGSAANSCSGTGPGEGTGWNLGRPALDPAAAARAAVLLSSCVPDDRANARLRGFYYRRNKDQLWDLDAAACLANKTSGCQGVTECTGISVTVGGSCSQHCSGSMLEFCDGSVKYVADCNKLGARCDATEGCIACDAGATCSGSTFQGRCEAGRPVTCSDGHETTGVVCADLGLECGPEPSGLSDPPYYGCYGTGASCDAQSLGPGLLSGTGCSGTKLDACVGGKAFSIECSEVGAGFTCQQFASGASFFCGLGSQCDPETSGDSTCDGTSTTVCNAGRIDKVDCVALGFTGCDAKSGRCVPGPYGSL